MLQLVLQKSVWVISWFSLKGEWKQGMCTSENSNNSSRFCQGYRRLIRSVIRSQPVITVSFAMVTAEVCTSWYDKVLSTKLLAPNFTLLLFFIWVSGREGGREGGRKGRR